MAQFAINGNIEDYAELPRRTAVDYSASETQECDLKSGDLGGSHSHFQTPRGVTSDTAALVLDAVHYDYDDLNGSDYVRPGLRGTGDGYVHCHRPVQQPDTLARNQLIAVSVLCALFMAAEIVGGVLSGSLALMTDATHMACDLLGFLVSLLSIWLARRKATKRLSFGFHRAEVLGAFFSVLLIWVLTGVLVYLAVERVKSKDYDIVADDMLIVASLGVIFNIIMGVVLHSGLCMRCEIHSNFGHGHSHSSDHGHSHDALTTHGDPDVRVSTPQKQNINVRAAMVHVVGDLIQSIGVLIAAIIIKVEPSFKLADPICTFVFSILVLFTTFIVLRDVVLIFMEAVPRDLDYSTIKIDLEKIGGVRTVHSLNIWALTPDKVAAAVHIAIDCDTDWSRVLEKATNILQDVYNVHQSTVQVEKYDLSQESCELCNTPA